MISKEEYIVQEIDKACISNTVNDLLSNLNHGKRVIFTKFGDGEGHCMLYNVGQNCDNDTYTHELGLHLKTAFLTLCSMDDVYLGKWHSNRHILEFCVGSLYDYFVQRNIPLKQVPFVDYHYCYPDQNFNKSKDLYEFVKTLQTSNKNKIVVSNKNNKNLKLIFKGNIYIEIPDNSWFANGLYDEIFENLNTKLNENPDSIILIAGGLASKVLICNLALRHKYASFIDIGSGFDILSQNKYTRVWDTLPGFHNSFEKQCQYFSDLLPESYYEKMINNEFIVE